MRLDARRVAWFDESRVERPDAILLFLHGLGCGKDDFRPALAHPATRQHRLVGLDFPGHGETPYDPAAPLDVDALVALTHAFIEARDLRDLTLVGHSLGGLVALRYLMFHGGSRVHGFVNVEGNLAPEDCLFTRDVVRHDRALFVREVFPDLVDRLAASPAYGSRVYAAGMADRVSPFAYYDYSPSIVEASDRDDLLGTFLALDLPRLFVHGAENADFSYLPALRASACAVRSVPDSGHFPFHDAPDAFYRVVAEFASSC